MAFERFSYSKSWENPADFPAYEPDEMQVRADLQLLFDEAAQAVNTIIDKLNDTSAAANLPFAPTENLTAQTVQEAVEEVMAQVQDACAGLIADGSITKQKLETALLRRVYGGRVWVSLDAPSAADDPTADFPVGQLWLCPGFTLDAEEENWQVTGGSFEDGVFVSDGEGDTLTAAQVFPGLGAPHGRVYVQVSLGETDAHLQQLSLCLNGMEQELTESEILEAELDAAGDLEVELQAQWAYETDAAVEAVVRVFNTGMLEASIPECEGCSDWESVLSSEDAPLVRPGRIYLQTAPGVWEELHPICLPVERGGTGLTHVDEDAIVCGGTASKLRALPPANGLLQHTAQGLSWLTPAMLAENGGYLRTETGTYIGGSGDVQLPVTPLILLITPVDGSIDTAVLLNGGRAGGEYVRHSGGSTIPYHAWVQLSERTVSFSADYANQERLHMNVPDKEYRWLAIY